MLVSFSLHWMMQAVANKVSWHLPMLIMLGFDQIFGLWHRGRNLRSNLILPQHHPHHHHHHHHCHHQNTIISETDARFQISLPLSPPNSSDLFCSPWVAGNYGVLRRALPSWKVCSVHPSSSPCLRTDPCRVPWSGRNGTLLLKKVWRMGWGEGAS